MSHRIPALLRRGGRGGVRAAGGGAPEMPSTLLSYWAEDYDTGTNTWPNRGSLGSSGDLELDGSAPTKGTDAVGPYVDFTSTTGWLETPDLGAFDTGYSSSDFTVYVLIDVVASSGFIFDLQRSGQRITYRSEAARQRILDSAYRDYTSAGAGSLHYGAYVLNGAVPEGRGYLVGGTPDANNPVVYNPQFPETGVRIAIGALAVSGSTPFAGKIRAVSIAPAAHDAGIRAQAEAAHAAVWDLS